MKIKTVVFNLKDIICYGQETLMTNNICDSNLELREGMYDYLYKLYNEGFKIVILIDAYHEIYSDILNKFDLYKYIEFICPLKSNEEIRKILFNITVKLKVKYFECIVFSNSLSILKISKLLGMYTAGVIDDGLEFTSENYAYLDAYFAGYNEIYISNIEFFIFNEKWDVFNDSEIKVGKTAKGCILQKGKYHKSISVWVANNQNKFLMSKRQRGKEYELKWECTGGAVQYGESGLEAAVRESYEELGIHLFKQNGKLIKKILREKQQDFYEVWLFKQNVDIKQIKINSSEVICAKWMTQEDIERIANSKLHPLLFYYQEVFSLIEKVQI